MSDAGDMKRLGKALEAIRGLDVVSLADEGLNGFRLVVGRDLEAGGMQGATRYLAYLGGGGTFSSYRAVVDPKAMAGDSFAEVPLCWCGTLKEAMDGIRADQIVRAATVPPVPVVYELLTRKDGRKEITRSHGGRVCSGRIFPAGSILAEDEWAVLVNQGNGSQAWQ